MTGRAAQRVTVEQVLSDLGALRQEVERNLRLQRLRDVQTTTHFVEKGAGAPVSTAPEGTLYWDTAGDDLYINDAGINTWTLIGGGGGAIPHSILSVTHSDSVAQVVSRGSLIYGDATPDWNELVHPGAADRVFQSAALDVQWSAQTLTLTTALTNQGAAGTLNWGGIFTLTVPATGTAALGTGAANHAAYWNNVNTLTNEAQLALSRGGSAADLSATGGASQYVQQAGVGAAFTVGAILAGDLPNLGGLPALTYGVANAAGVAATYVRTDATLAVFDVVVPGTIQCDDAAGTGAVAFAARRDHQHAIVCAVPVNIANANVEGVATSFSRSDHIHNHPAALGTDLHHAEAHVVNSIGPHAEAGLTIGHVLRASGAAAFSFAAIQAGDLPNLGGMPALTYGVANAAGVAATYVRTDATLAVFDAVVPGTIQCDDAAGAGVAGVTARRDHQHAIVCAVPVDIANANAEGVATSFSRSDHVHNHPAALGVDLHHTEVHVVNSTGSHAEAGLTIGHVLRVSGAAAFSFAAIQAGDVPGLGGVPALTLGLVNAAGAAATYVQTDASVAIFDAVAPGTIQCDDAAAAGVVAFAARRDHQHAIVNAAPIANLSVTSTNQEGAAYSFARSDHSHAITTSSNPGAAASILASDANGYVQLTGLGIGAAAGAANRITMADGGTIGQAAGPLIEFDDTLNYLEITGCSVGIGTAAPDGTLHVHTASAGVVTATAQADNLVVEGTGQSGISILTEDDQLGWLVFGSPNDNFDGGFFYDNDVAGGDPRFGVRVASATRASIYSDRAHFAVDVGIGEANPIATLHIEQTTTTGSAFFAYRDLAAASTDGAVANITQDNAGDDQAALEIDQDGTGPGLYIVGGGYGIQCIGASTTLEALWVSRATVAVANTPVVKLSQGNVAGVCPVLELSQLDVDQPYLEFTGATIHTGKSGADEYLMILTASGTRYLRCYS